jgi:N-acetylglucosamine-6-sulfatase
MKGKAGTALSLLLSACTADEAPRPNILLVFTDDHAVRAVGAYGSGLNDTPRCSPVSSGT